MESSDLWKLALFVVCLVLSAFFSSSETAFIALPRSHLMFLANSGNSAARLAFQLVQHPERLLATVLLSNNLVNTAAAALGTAIAISLIQNSNIAVLVSTVAVTFLLLVFSETLPKTVAWKRPEQVAFTFARPLALVGWLLYPAVQILQGIATLFTKLLGIDTAASRSTEQEIRTLITIGAQTGEMGKSEAALLEKVFHFGDRQVREIMTARPEIIWIEQGTTLEKFLSLYAEHSHTRFPVYEGSMENVIGVLSNKDVIVAMGKGEVKPEDSVTNLLRPAYFVPETKTVSSTFAEMQENGYGLALTVNEFGGIAGVATLRQLLEVIVGEVRDEDGDAEEGYTSIDEHTYNVVASIGVTDINEKLDLNIPEGHYETLAGFLLEQLGYIPDKGEVLYYENLIFTIRQTNGVRIEEVEVKMTTPVISEVVE